MANPIDRSVSARAIRRPDVFLSHSARDKEFVWKLAEDLAFCQVDAWLDRWELQPGESLHDVIGSALTTSKFIAIVVGPNFSDSRWASEEMRQGMARERREGRTVVIPLLAADSELPVFLEDKLYVDLRTEYFAGVVRIAALVHGIPRQHIEEGIRAVRPNDISGAINTLRCAGFEPYVIMSVEDASAILSSGGEPYINGKVRFSPEEVAANPKISARLREVLRRLDREVWR